MNEAVWASFAPCRLVQCHSWVRWGIGTLADTHLYKQAEADTRGPDQGGGSFLPCRRGETLAIAVKIHGCKQCFYRSEAISGANTRNTRAAGCIS